MCANVYIYAYFQTYVYIYMYYVHTYMYIYICMHMNRRIFAQADAIMGVHGAALSYVVMCRRGTPVLEMGYALSQDALLAGSCSMLQCVAVCCSVLHCVAVHCSALQCIAVYCCNEFVAVETGHALVQDVLPAGVCVCVYINTEIAARGNSDESADAEI